MIKRCFKVNSRFNRNLKNRSAQLKPSRCPFDQKGIASLRSDNGAGYTETFAVYLQDFDSDKWIGLFALNFSHTLLCNFAEGTIERGREGEIHQWFAQNHTD
ncbi:MAG: hypothetical protein ACI9G1_003583 [Pirellulaceae bacterium]